MGRPILTDKRMPQLTDKTTDDRYFILTLFAIGKELADNVGASFVAKRGGKLDIVLLAGLPPLHCKEFGQRFSNYFKNHGQTVNFEFNKINFNIRICDVHIYPQAYAAAIHAKDTLAGGKTIGIVDIGGYTCDLLLLNDFRPDMNVCTSIYQGVNTLFQQINEQVRAKGAKDIPDAIIEGILRGDKRVLTDCSQDRISLVKTTAKAFAKELLLSVSQAGIDLAESRTAFIGGGSLLLRKQIESVGMVSKPIFIEAVTANAAGYKVLYENRKAS
ncbi:MAG: ParM/StbA family protein [Oscillospiraceae bacterium]|nr:ParM/StbA family protein [Oscillospiraceae bacterium]